MTFHPLLFISSFTWATFILFSMFFIEARNNHIETYTKQYVQNIQIKVSANSILFLTESLIYSTAKYSIFSCQVLNFLTVCHQDLIDSDLVCSQISNIIAPQYHSTVDCLSFNLIDPEQGTLLYIVSRHTN